MKLAWLGLPLLAIGVLPSQPAHAAEFVLMPGINLSSPRTALRDPASFIGFNFGAGANIRLEGNAHLLVELDYVYRRFAGTASVPTLLMPVIGRFENKYLILGAGPYVGVTMGISADNGVATTLGEFSTFEAGLIFELGLKLPLTRRVTVVLDGRLSRALTAAYDIPSETFYWAQLMGYIGFQIKVGKNARAR